MQLFGLVNAMLSNDRSTAERDLSIARYAVIPLSPNSGNAPSHFCIIENTLWTSDQARTLMHLSSDWQPGEIKEMMC